MLGGLRARRGSDVRSLVLTDPGLESVACDELRECWPSAETCFPLGDTSGRLIVELPGDADFTRLRTAHHVVRLLGESDAASLEDVRLAVRQVEIPELESAASFRVTTSRKGDHAFKSEQIAGAAGAVLQQRYGTPVDLSDYEVNVRADLHGARLTIGVQLTRESLGARMRRTVPLRTALKPTIAAAMVRLSGAHQGHGTLLDPMCGAGTVPFEASTTNPALRVIGTDWDLPTLHNARRTLRDNGVDVPLVAADVRHVADVVTQRFDFVVTDPPYGVRQARRARLSVFYARMLHGIVEALADRARVVLISPRRQAMLRALGEVPLEVVDERQVETGGLRPRIWVTRRG